MYACSGLDRGHRSHSQVSPPRYTASMDTLPVRLDDKRLGSHHTNCLRYTLDGVQFVRVYDGRNERGCQQNTKRRIVKNYNK